MQTERCGSACGICSLERGCAPLPRGALVTGRTGAGAPLRVRIERTLARGGMGVVCAGRLDDGRAVAVKILQARHARDPGLGGRFAREIGHAMRVRHPNVVATHAAGQLDDGRPFLVMDHLEGATLGALVRADGPLSLARGLHLGEQILAGLEALHEAGLVHRDLSPDNVFVAREPSGSERAVLIDLGFAQAPGVDAGDGVTIDSRGSLVGTLAFMAPEQALRARAITARSDLFSAALLVYFALTGASPFGGRDARDVLVSLVRAAPVPLRRHRRDAPAALEKVLARALAKHPDARFAGAGEMRRALRSAVPLAVA